MRKGGRVILKVAMKLCSCFTWPNYHYISPVITSNVVRLIKLGWYWPHAGLCCVWTHSKCSLEHWSGCKRYAGQSLQPSFHTWFIPLCWYQVSFLKKIVPLPDMEFPVPTPSLQACLSISVISYYGTQSAEVFITSCGYQDSGAVSSPVLSRMSILITSFPSPCKCNSTSFKTSPALRPNTLPGVFYALHLQPAGCHFYCPGTVPTYPWCNYQKSPLALMLNDPATHCFTSEGTVVSITKPSAFLVLRSTAYWMVCINGIFLFISIGKYFQASYFFDLLLSLPLIYAIYIYIYIIGFDHTIRRA